MTGKFEMNLSPLLRVLGGPVKNPAVPLRRSALLCLLLPVLSVAASAQQPLTIKRVYTGWREAASFKRISEYFNGQENTHGEAMLRTQPGERGGFYFLVRVENPGPARSIKALLHVITSVTSKPVEYRFAPELKPGDTIFHLGLTGTDWPDPKAHPVAWKLELADSDGQLLASETSYLWEKPAAK